MSAPAQVPTEELRSPLKLDRARARRILLTVAALGLVASVIQALLVEQGYRRWMMAYVVAFAYVLSLALGSLFFVVVTHLFKAAWSVAVRRVSEVLAANVLWLVPLFLPIAFTVLRGGAEVYPWAQPLPPAAEHGNGDVGAVPAGEDPGTRSGPMQLVSLHSAAREDAADSHSVADSPDSHGHALDERILRKRAFLNPAAFLLRWAVLLSIWIFLAGRFWKGSVRQDESGDIAITRRLEILAAPTAVVFLLTLTLGAGDLLMSLDPHWYSTIFGIYYFSGCAVAGLSSLILGTLWLQRGRGLTAQIGREHRRDLGRLLFAFTFFWAYIAFSQYMLLWYANLPETTGWLVRRGLSTAEGGGNGWSKIAVLLLLGHFVVPFAGLMSRHVKSNRALLAFWAVWMLTVHFFDLLWLVMPEFSSSFTLGAVEIGLLVALVAVFLLGALGRTGQRPLVPLGDPRLAASLGHSEMY